MALHVTVELACCIGCFYELDEVLSSRYGDVLLVVRTRVGRRAPSRFPGLYNEQTAGRQRRYAVTGEWHRGCGSPARPDGLAFERAALDWVEAVERIMWQTLLS